MSITASRAEPAAEAAPARRRTTLGNRLTAGRSVSMLPAGVLLIGFMLGPILYSLYLAFTDSAIRGDGASDTSFVGLDNFTAALTDGDFWNSVVLTLVFTIVSAVIGQNILGMLLALLMERANRVLTFIVTSIEIAAWITETTFRPLWNSLLLCGGATLLTMTAAVLCAYPMSRFRSGPSGRCC